MKLKLTVRREPDPPAPTMARMAPPKSSVSASSSSQNLNLVPKQQQDQQSQRGASRAVSPGRGDSTDGDGGSIAPAGQTSRKQSSACSEQRTNFSINSALTSSPLASPQNVRRARVPFDPTANSRNPSGTQQGEMLSPGWNGNTAAGQNTLDHFISGALSLFGKRK